MNPRRRKNIVASACVCCKRNPTALATASVVGATTVVTKRRDEARISSCSVPNGASPTDTDEHAEERRLLSEFKAQEKIVISLMENVKRMDIYTAETEQKLRESLQREIDFNRDYDELKKLFEDFQEAVKGLLVSRIFLKSLSQDLINSDPELKDVATATEQAISVCYAIMRQKKHYLKKLKKQLAELNKENQKLKDELRNTKEMQKDAEKKVSELMENIKSCKDQFGSIYEEEKTGIGKKSKVVGLKMDICITSQPAEA